MDKPIKVQLLYEEKHGYIKLVLEDTVNNIIIEAVMDEQDAERFIEDFTIAAYKCKKKKVDYQ